jgi:hypothetical protein
MREASNLHGPIVNASGFVPFSRARRARSRWALLTYFLSDRPPIVPPHPQAHRPGSGQTWSTSGNGSPHVGQAIAPRSSACCFRPFVQDRNARTRAGPNVCAASTVTVAAEGASTKAPPVAARHPSPGIALYVSVSTGRAGVRRSPRKAQQPKAPRPPVACRYCGVILELGRRVCDDCLIEHRRERSFPFANAGPVALARLRAEGRDPTAAPEAREKQGRSMSDRNRERVEWDRANPQADRDPETFRQEVLAGLQRVTIRRIVEATGLSLRHCARIRRGEVVPHPRHWPALRSLVQEPHRQAD